MATLNVLRFARHMLGVVGRMSGSLLVSQKQECDRSIYIRSVGSARLQNRTRIEKLTFRSSNFQVALLLSELGAKFRVSLSCELRHSQLFSEL